MLGRLGLSIGVLGAFFAAFTAAMPATVLNATVSRDGYRVHRDLSYGDQPRQKLDLYVPDQSEQKMPVLLFFYGGNWRSGDKDMYLAFGQAFASAGMIVAVADYRLYPDVRYPDFLMDGAQAFRYVQQNVERFGGDPRRIFLAGHSAGAYNAVMLAAEPRYLRSVGASLADVRGVIGLAGPYDFLPLRDPTLVTLFGGRDRRETQPVVHIDGARPPMFLATGADDTTVEPRNTESMARALRAVGSAVETRTYPGVGHVGLILSVAQPFRGRAPLRDDIIRFVRSH